MPAFLSRVPAAIACLGLLAAWPCTAKAQGADTPVIVIPPDRSAVEVNPTGREVAITAPVMDGTNYLGDAPITLLADGTVTFGAERLLMLLEERIRSALSGRLRATLSSNGALTPADLQSAGIGIHYDPRTLEITLTIAPASRAASVVDLGANGQRTVTYAEPAELSAYLNVRGAMDWVQQGSDEGIAAPVMFVDGAARFKGIVFESEANWQPGAAGVDLQRRGSRFVYDDRESVVRWTAGDLLTLARGFQSAPPISGLSIERRYSILEPQTIVRPRGSRSFELERRTLVEVKINSQLVRRIELEPGTYDLQDFPFTQGANDVELTLTDDAGRTETIDFDIFLDQAQLAQGLSEFGFYAGVLAPVGFSAPKYSDEPAFSGFYRRGLTEWLTLGANVQADTSGWMGGGEAVVATPIGSLAAFGSASHVDRLGSGWAALMTFQRTIGRGGSGADALSLSLEAKSRDFAPVGVRTPSNPYSLVASGSYSTTFAEGLYGAFDLRYSRGRDIESDVTSARGTLGWSISPRLTFTGDLTYEHDARGDRFGTFLSLTYRFGRSSSLRADYDSRYDRARLSYQTFGGSGIGAYSINADVEHSEIGAGTSVNANYYASRAEFGFSHFGLFERDLGASTGQRSSLRFGSSIAYADGAATVGRPIHDAFALVKAHRSLGESEVLVDPSDDTAVATTGALGTALQPNLSSYSDRSLLVSAPEAPYDLDLGAGSYRLLPPYRGGYLLTIGSDYNVSAVGRLLTASGDPLALVSGFAHEVAEPDREPIAFFTNRDGRFGLTGLAPGSWRLALAGAEAEYTIEVPPGERTVSLGEVTP